jgi:hypothetical protein
MLAESLYGASLAQGRTQLEEAALLAPEILAVRFGCAIALLEADPRRYRQDALAILEPVARGAAVRADARCRLDLLKSGDWEGFGAARGGVRE